MVPAVMKKTSRMTLVASLFTLHGPFWPPRIAAVLVPAARFLSGPRLLRAAVLGVASMAVVDVLHAQDSAALRIESWTRRDSEMELRLAFPTEWGRRYRIEASTDLVSWETKLVTEPSQGSALAVVVKAPAATPHFFRATLFDWEELRAEVQAGRQRWRTNGLVTYQFQFHWRCIICHPNFRELVRVDVRDGSIVRVTKLATGEALPPDQWVHYTVEGLFDWIEGKLALHPEVIRVTFDPVLGHPVSGFVDQSSLMNDEEMGFELSALGLLGPAPSIKARPAPVRLK
jgi:hypothetical protein